MSDEHDLTSSHRRAPYGLDHAGKLGEVEDDQVPHPGQALTASAFVDPRIPEPYYGDVRTAGIDWFRVGPIAIALVIGAAAGVWALWPDRPNVAPQTSAPPTMFAPRPTRTVASPEQRRTTDPRASSRPPSPSPTSRPPRTARPSASQQLTEPPRPSASSAQSPDADVNTATPGPQLPPGVDENPCGPGSGIDPATGSCAIQEPPG